MLIGSPIPNKNMHDHKLAGNLQDRSPAVDFIDQRLPEHHPAFLDAPSLFDDKSDQYVSIFKASSPQTAVATTADSAHGLQTGVNAATVVGVQNPQSIETRSMRFWNDIFPEAMRHFLDGSAEPRTLAIKPGSGIRNAKDWDEVCSQLKVVKKSYTDGDGTFGILKRARRNVAENLSQPVAHIAKMVPDIDPWTTPVVGTVGILLQAMSTAAKTRQEVLKSLSDLDETFLNIDSFTATFPRDVKVRQTSILLVVAIFTAVERAMEFFAKSAGQSVLESISQLHSHACCFKRIYFLKRVLISLNRSQSCSSSFHRGRLSEGAAREFS